MTQSRNADKFVCRLPDGMRDQLANVAATNRRSMNSDSAKDQALRVALQMLQDLNEGYAWNELGETLQGVKAQAEAAGVTLGS